MIVGSLEGGNSSNSRKAWAWKFYVGTIYGRHNSLKKACQEAIVFTYADLPRDMFLIKMHSS